MKKKPKKQRVYHLKESQKQEGDKNVTKSVIDFRTSYS